MKVFNVLFLFSLIVLAGCSTSNQQYQSGGKISHKSPMGDSIVLGADNSESPAELNRKDSEINFSHKEGDVLVIQAKTAEGAFESIKNLFSKTEGNQSEENSENISIQNSNDEIKITFFPKEGASTHFKGSNIIASTGYSREDAAAITREIFQNTKYIQYAGVLFIVAGSLVIIVLKAKGQGIFLASIGTGMIILQSTLHNPMWSWVMILLVIFVPAFWIFYHFRNKKSLKVVVKGNELFMEKYPEMAEAFKDCQRKAGANDMTKKVIKETKQKI